jgi:hypothetical protein
VDPLHVHEEQREHRILQPGSHQVKAVGIPDHITYVPSFAEAFARTDSIRVAYSMVPSSQAR